MQNLAERVQILKYMACKGFHQISWLHIMVKKVILSDGFCHEHKIVFVFVFYFFHSTGLRYNLLATICPKSLCVAGGVGVIFSTLTEYPFLDKRMLCLVCCMIPPDMYCDCCMYLCFLMVFAVKIVF